MPPLPCESPEIIPGEVELTRPHCAVSEGEGPQRQTAKTRTITHGLSNLLVICLLLSLISTLLVGCTSPIKLNEEWSPALPKWPSSDTETPDPDRILAIWSDTVLHRKGQPATRGFGGRILFYSETQKDPIKVEGALTVYAFDAETDATVPEKKFVFPAELLDDLHSKCSLGHSYSLWLPWDKVGGPTRQVSLVVRFEGTESGVVLSKPARKLLPGVAAPVAAPTITKSTNQVQRVSHEEVASTVQPGQPTQIQEPNAFPLPASIDRITLGRPGQTITQPHVLPTNSTPRTKLATHTIDLPAEFSKRISTYDQALQQAQSLNTPNGYRTRVMTTTGVAPAWGAAQSAGPTVAPTALAPAAARLDTLPRTNGQSSQTPAESSLGTTSVAPVAPTASTASNIASTAGVGSQPLQPPAPFAASTPPNGPVWPSRPRPIRRQYDR